MTSVEKHHPFIISEENGFTLLPTESVSSKVFVRGEFVYKINSRNSVERQQSDFKTIRTELHGYEDHLPETQILSCIYEGKEYVCVVQPRIKGKELKQLGREEVIKILQENQNSNRDFIARLLTYFFDAVSKKELYPDIVGYPENPEFFNSVNLLLEEETGKIFLCDVGLSPHEDTLKDYAGTWYESDKMKIYASKMSAFLEILSALTKGDSLGDK